MTYCLIVIQFLCIAFAPLRCPESLRPETVRPCLLPCRKDCIVTPYSDWTSCPSSCQEGTSIEWFLSQLFVVTDVQSLQGLSVSISAGLNHA